jgi:hypothetical protein
LKIKETIKMFDDYTTLIIQINTRSKLPVKVAFLLFESYQIKLRLYFLNVLLIICLTKSIILVQYFKINKTNK